MNQLVAQILDTARSRGLSQKDLALRASVPEETLSRLKGKADVRTDVLERLANVVGLTVSLSSKGKTFQEKYRTLVASNPGAPPEVFVRKALLHPDFSVLLDAALAFGLPMLNEQWGILEAEKSPEATRAAPAAKRMLRNISDGYNQARV